MEACAPSTAPARRGRGAHAVGLPLRPWPHLFSSPRAWLCEPSAPAHLEGGGDAGESRTRPCEGRSSPRGSAQLPGVLVGVTLPSGSGRGGGMGFPPAAQRARASGCEDWPVKGRWTFRWGRSVGHGADALSSGQWPSSVSCTGSWPHPGSVGGAKDPAPAAALGVSGTGQCPATLLSRQSASLESPLGKPQASPGAQWPLAVWPLPGLLSLDR